MIKPATLFRTLRVSPLIAAMFGLAVVVLILATPNWLFGRFVEASGLPLIVSVARPPLGDTARALAAIVGGLVITGAVWLTLTVLRRLVKPERIAPRGVRISPAIIVPAAPPADPAPASAFRGGRAPIFAGRDLGAPFMSDEAVQRAEPSPVGESDAVTLSQTNANRADVFTLDTVAEAVSAAPRTVPTAFAPAPEPVVAAHASAAVYPFAVAADHGDKGDDATISDLLGRLETILARKHPANRPAQGDIMSLRRTLSQF